MMGEVENAVVEEPTSPKVNGGSNGDHEDEIMDVMQDATELKKSLQKNGSENGKSNGNVEDIEEIEDLDDIEEVEAMEVDTAAAVKPVNGDSNDDEPTLALNNDSNPLNGRHEVNLASKLPKDLHDESKKEENAVVLSDSEDDAVEEDEDRLKASEESGDSDNGNTSAGSTTNPSKMDVDEKPVSIHSDTEDEESLPGKTNGKEVSESDGNSSDKDDCIVIDDDDKKERGVQK